MDFDRRSNDLAAEVVRFLICWMDEENLLQKATKKTKVRFAPQKPALRYLRFLLLILFRSVASLMALKEDLREAIVNSQRPALWNYYAAYTLAVCSALGSPKAELISITVF